MSRTDTLIMLVVIGFAVIGVGYVGEQLDPSPGLSTAGQIAVFVGALLLIWLIERAWRRGH